MKGGIQMQHYLKASKLLNDIIIYSSKIDDTFLLSTLHNYYNDIAKMLYLDKIDIILLDEIDKLFKKIKKSH